MRRKITNEAWSEIKTAYASGIALRELSRNTGISAGTILSRSKREGWTHEIQNAKALAKREDAPVVTPFKAVAMTIQQRGERHVERMAGVSECGVDHIETMDGAEILDSVDRIQKLDKVARRTFGLNDDDAYNPNALVNINMLCVSPEQACIKDASRESEVSE